MRQLFALIFIVAARRRGHLSAHARRPPADRPRAHQHDARRLHGPLSRRRNLAGHARPRADRCSGLRPPASSMGVPVYVRIFKLEHELEIWVEKDGRFVRFATYPICLWSGTARAEAERGRSPGAGGLLYGRRRAAQSEQPSCIAPSVSASPICTTRRMGAPAPSSWCMAAAPRSAATPSPIPWSTRSGGW